jgi:hypothetical protein
VPEAERERRPAESPGGALTWTAWPARQRPLAAAVLVGSAIVLGVLVAHGTQDGVLGVTTPLFILVSLSSFLMPTTYRLTEDAVEVRSLGVARVRPWTEMRRMTVDQTGIFLSPFEKRSWLEAYRGVRLLFGGNRDQVVAFVEARLKSGTAAS